MMKSQVETIDPRINEYLDALRPTPERDPADVARGRGRFLAELDTIPEVSPQPLFTWLAGWTSTIQKLKETATMKLQNQKVVLTAITTMIILFVFLFGGAGVTAYASQKALPGDALYGVKTGLEQTQAVLSRDAANRAELYMDFAERRLEEITKLIAEGRFEDINKATDEFEYYVGKALESLQTVAAGDPARAGELSQNIFAALTSYGQALSDMRVQLPDLARQAIDRAIVVSQLERKSTLSSEGDSDEDEFVGMVESISPEAWVIGGQTFLVNALSEIKGSIGVGDTVKVHFTTGEDGSLTLSEVEIVSGDDNANVNENGNDNTNTNENANENANENTNENTNVNENDNEINDENSNNNENDIDDGNTNDNENQDGDENANVNDNDDGASMNENNDNGQSNDNSDNHNGNENSLLIHALWVI